MKISLTIATVLSLAASTAAFHPTKISFDDLANADLLTPLQHVGMVSVTGVPFEGNDKQATLKALADCLSAKPSDEVAEDVLDDGSRRRTLATHSDGLDEPAPLDSACPDLDQHTGTFRATAARVVESLFAALSAQLGKKGCSRPVLMGNDKAGISLQELVKTGEHLEHFHCYQKDQKTSGDDHSIQWHTDQGLALFFTPGAVDNKPTDGFMIQLQDGSVEEVVFDQDDDIVLLLGDGVNQYLNKALAEDGVAPLRAVPHAVQLPVTSPGSPRVWYGRMVLPPAHAVHPADPTLTFGAMRNGMISELDKEHDIGCSGTQKTRELQSTSCTSAQDFCWHQCMNHTDYNASTAICAGRSLSLACVNDDGFLWIGDHNPDFKLGCVNLTTAQNYTIPKNDTDHDDHDHDDHDDHDHDDHDHDDHDHDEDDKSGAFATSLVFSAVAAAASVFMM